MTCDHDHTQARVAGTAKHLQVPIPKSLPQFMVPDEQLKQQKQFLSAAVV
jgi:hypothetical protein